ncbi:hypothetical protein N0V85_008894 [Neurospora sp. IMI 360204]|nr:hypothetical protein N0V85_008894 [Neurospora sp. IMI 360204]
MFSPLFSLGFAPHSLTFRTSNVVKAIAIASFAALSVKLLLNTVAPSQADHDHEHHPVDDKVHPLDHANSSDDINANNLTQTAQDAELPKHIASANSDDGATTDSIDNDEAAAPTEVVVAPNHGEVTKHINIADDFSVTQVADSPATADDTEIDTDVKEACPSQNNDIQEITTDATPIINDEDPAINPSNGVRSYRHSFPALDIIEVVEIPNKQAAVYSYRHSFPDIDIIEVIDIPSEQTTVITSPIPGNNNTATSMLANEQESTTTHNTSPKADEAILNHTRKDSTATNFSTDSQQTANSDLSATTPETPDTLYSVPDIGAIDQLTPSGTKGSEEDEKHEGRALTPTAAANTTSRDDTRSKWYDFSHLSPEELNNLDTVIVIDRPDNGVSYAQLTCGFWYRMDENDNPLCMTQAEYEDLLAWFASFGKKEEEIKPRSKWYDFSHLSSEQLNNLDTVIVIDRPDNGISYAQLTCGFGYRMDENDNPLLMTQEEYEDLLAWFASFEKKEDDVKLPPPVVLVTDEEGNERLAEEDDETSFESQVLDLQDRSEHGVKYVLLTNGTCHYLDEDAKTAKPMTEDEYEEFVFWLHEKEAEFDERLTQEDPTIQASQGIELFTYADEITDANDTNNAQEFSDELEQWQEAEYNGTSFNIVGLIDHPDGDKQFATGSDDQVYWLIDGMFCLLDENELDRFNRWRDGDKTALYEPIKELKKPEGKEHKWKAPDLDAIIEEDEEEAEDAAEEYEVKKWNKWGLYAIGEEEEEEEEEDYADLW